MMRALYTAASGMMAQQLNIDNISHNLANVGSTGYKKSRLDFEDLLYANMENPGSEATGNLQVGMGVRSASTTRLFEEGSVQQTGNPFDVAIMGDGFFSVTLPDGSKGYTRDGAFKLDAQQNLVTGAGYSLGIRIPEGTTNVSIEQDGRVMGIPKGQTAPVPIGQIKLTRFLNPVGLKAIGGNTYQATAVAGEITEDKPMSNGLGTLAAGNLEKSNVNVVEEMIAIIQAQRAFELNSKSVKAADDMMRMANQLKQS